jgi:hypothetical protein
MNGWDIFWFIASAVSIGILGGLLGLAMNRIHDSLTKRKSNGRHRKAAEAHRVGADPGAGDGAGRGSRGRSGASVSGGIVPGGYWQSGANPNSYALLRSQLLGTWSGVAPQVGLSNEFSGTEFAAGVVTGARSFKIDRLGRLLGINYETVWTPTEMHARCLTDDGDIRDAAAGALGEKSDHNLTSCPHGFYAYYDGSNDYYKPGYVAGVIEGYGEAVIGTRGFRCMKARIVALHIPADVNPALRRLVARNYADTPQFDSFDAMVTAYPTDDGGKGISPDTDPDFWTRSI